MSKYSLFIFGLIPTFLWAAPLDPQVAHGSANFSSDNNAMEIACGSRTIINWQSFSIDQNESVIFNQLDSSSSVLNRVLSQDASTILGTLQSSGSLLLINPNGVLIDAGDVPFIGPLASAVRSTAARIDNSLSGNRFSVITVQNGDLNMNKLNKQDTSNFRFHFSLVASY